MRRRQEVVVLRRWSESTEGVVPRHVQQYPADVLSRVSNVRMRRRGLMNYPG